MQKRKLKKNIFDKFKPNIKAFQIWYKNFVKKDIKKKKSKIKKSFLKRSNQPNKRNLLFLLRYLRRSFIKAKKKIFKEGKIENTNNFPKIKFRYLQYLKQIKSKYNKKTKRFMITKAKVLGRYRLLDKLKKLKLKLPVLSKTLLKIFLRSIAKAKNHPKLSINNKLDVITNLMFRIHKRFKRFTFKKIKRNILIHKKLLTSKKITDLNDKIHTLAIENKKKVLVKKNFIQYITKNLIFDKLNLTDKPQINSLFKNTSDILRADHFTSIHNKEQNYFQQFIEQQNPLRLLTTITGHNIYLTLFISKPYKILWKVSAGMLGLKKFRKSKKHQITFKDLLTRCQLFMAKNKNHPDFKNRQFQLIIRDLNYFGTRNLINAFMKQPKNSSLFEKIKEKKIFNFFKQNQHLINKHVLQYMSTLWARENKKDIKKKISFRPKISKVAKLKKKKINKQNKAIINFHYKRLYNLV